MLFCTSKRLGILVCLAALSGPSLLARAQEQTEPPAQQQTEPPAQEQAELPVQRQAEPPVQEQAEPPVQESSAPEGEVELEPSASTEAQENRLSDIVVRGQVEQAFRTGGSVHRLEEADLRRLRYDDPIRLITQIPGVYVRPEDGWGLRPNIGLRGASAERSSKITLMEDGVLLAPAPYSAPAAYYFPLMMRMTSVEVLMGAAGIPYGPNTVGGAINYGNRPIPRRAQGRADVSLGMFEYGQLNLWYGASNNWGGFLVEAVHRRSRGYQHQDGAFRDGDTGFARTDLQVRGDLHGQLDANTFHRLDLVVGLGIEQSNETYVGLSDNDLRADPYRRYAGSALDRMEWWRTRAQLRYTIESGEDFDTTVTAYRHDFNRNWTRLNRFRGGPAIYDVVTDPTGARAVYRGILDGSEDSLTPDQALLVASNRRQFYSQGIQAVANGRFRTGDFKHHIQGGLRLHFDGVDRNQTENAYMMTNGRLVAEGTPEVPYDVNRASAMAFSGHVLYEVEWNNLKLTPGLRMENIWMDYSDRLSGASSNNFQQVLIPGIGAQYLVADPFAVFAGVHRGFSPVAPGQDAGVQPEQSWNYEIGGRYGRSSDATHGQLSFFLNDYSNLTANCGAAGGCSATDLDLQFNGGSVIVLGLEANLSHTFLVDEVRIPLRAAYTFTKSRFRSSFESANPQFGNVREGYELPYVPTHQGSLQAGVEWHIWSLHINGRYTGRMRETASLGEETLFTDDFVLLDANASVEVLPGIRIYARGENLTNVAPIVSRRPFGARTVRPVMLTGGLEFDL